MIANPENLEPHSSAPLPNSRRVYLSGEMHADVRVPMREIGQTPTRNVDGTQRVNPPIRVYDTSGPWGDPEFVGNVEAGLPAWRAPWIERRGDVEAYEGREVRPQDNEDRGARVRFIAPLTTIIHLPAARIASRWWLSLGSKGIPACMVVKSRSCSG